MDAWKGFLEWENFQALYQMIDFEWCLALHSSNSSNWKQSRIALLQQIDHSIAP